MKIKKCEKLVCNIYVKKNYVIHIESLEHLDHGLKLKKAHRVINFKQISWLKPWIDISTDLRNKTHE